MAKPRVLVLRAPGTNCDEETEYAFQLAGAETERVHVNRLIENPVLATRFQILCLPGGFSYGDDIAAGRILAGRMQRHLDSMIADFCGDNDQRLVLGICNGMQVLMRLGVLTQGLSQPDAATLTWNHHGRFEDRWVHLKTDPKSPCVFLRGIDQMYLPMAHAEGRFVTVSAAIREELRSGGRLAIRYSDSAGAFRDDPLAFPLNPNGSEANAAGVCDASGRIFGLMPHPERHLDPTHHPYWTRRSSQPPAGDGLKLFQNAVDYFA